MNIMKPACLLLTLSICSLPMFGADQAPPTPGQIIDGEVRQIEREAVRIAGAMPADKYNFAPTAGEFKGVRTFSQQISHMATIIYSVSAASMGEKSPVEMGKDENGPASIQGKDAVVKYLKDSLAYAHKAAAGLTQANMNDMLPSPFGQGKMSRLQILTVIGWHSYDHYGQAIEYVRMNGIDPQAIK